MAGTLAMDKKRPPFQFLLVILLLVSCLPTRTDAIFSRQSTSISLGVADSISSSCRGRGRGGGIGVWCKDPLVFSARSLSTAASSFSISGGSSSSTTNSNISTTSSSSTGEEEEQETNQNSHVDERSDKENVVETTTTTTEEMTGTTSTTETAVNGEGMSVVESVTVVEGEEAPAIESVTVMEDPSIEPIHDDGSIPETNTESVSMEIAAAASSTPPNEKEQDTTTNEMEYDGKKSKKVDKIPTEKQIKRQELKEKRKKAKEEKKKMRALSKKLKSRNSMNIKRKVLHAGFGLFFATLNQIIPKKFFVPAMTVISTGTLGVELLRYRKGFEWMNKIMHFVLGGTLRRQEMEGKFTGSLYYFTGVTITAALFPQSCASLGICQLALADPSASYFGMQTKHVYWSRIENGLMGIGRNKGILGFLGGALFCVPFNYRLLSIAKYGMNKATGSTGTPLPGSPQSVILASLLLGLAGAFADLLVPTPAVTMPNKVCGVPMPPFHLDDNVVVPILSGYACTKIFGFMGWTEGIKLAKFLII